MMPRHGCVYCGKYFFSESKLSGHTLFFHGKWKPDKILPKQSWASRERALYELTKMENQIKRQKIKIAKKGIITGSIILIIFTFLGSIIFQLYGITIEAFQIMGGIIFFRSGLRMLDAKVGRSRTTESEREEFKESDEIAISPIGIPLITGPGAITGVLILSGKMPSDYSLAILLIAVIITMVVFYFILRTGNFLSKRIGLSGTKRKLL